MIDEWALDHGRKKVKHVISDFANITKTKKYKNCNRPKTFLRRITKEFPFFLK